MSNGPREELYVILGCFGRVDDGFVSCTGIENQILGVGKHVEHHNEMMDYFDSCRLFDRAMFEYSAIRHFVHNLQDRFDQVAVGKRLWSEKQYTLYQKFIIDHRFCGLYVRLDLNLPVNEPVVEEKAVKIKAQGKCLISPPQVNLRLIRGHRDR